MNDELQGFAFPLRHQAHGGLSWKGGAEKMQQNLTTLLLTGIGERVMRRSYGGGVRDLLYDPNDDAMRAIVEHRILQAITQWEPRVTVQRMAINQEAGQLLVELHYAVRGRPETESVSVSLSRNGY